MILKIYLFRHAQTFYNKKHYFTGWKDSKLTPLGIRQSKKVARKLKNKEFDVAYQTRLSRSKDTLKEVLKFHPECKKIITDNRMIERCYGTVQGKSHKIFVKEEGEDSYKTLLHWHKIDHLSGKEKEEFIDKVGSAELQIIRRAYSVAPPKGESVKMVEKRVLSFIRDLLKKMKKEKINVAISAHGNSMRPFRRYFEKLTIDKMMSLENPWDDYIEYTIRV
jgi:2,3-bisphosphoglycerate-dependent phosphoglycerate mutase